MKIENSEQIMDREILLKLFAKINITFLSSFSFFMIIIITYFTRTTRG